MSSVTPDHFGYALESNTSLQRLLEGRWRCVASGHSHRRMVRQIGGVTFLSAGTLYREHDPGLLVADLGVREVVELTISPALVVSEARRLRI